MNVDSLQPTQHLAATRVALRKQSPIALLVSKADELGLLTHYREDLTTHDAGTLNGMSDWPEFLWFVGDTFSELVPVGLHPQAHDKAKDIVAARPSAKVFVLNAKALTLREIDLTSVASHLQRKPCWKRIDTALLDANGDHLAWVYLGFKPVFGRGSWHCEVDVRFQGPAASSKRRTILEWALYEAVRQKGLWVSVIDSTPSQHR